MIIALYVHDLLLAGKDSTAIMWMKAELSNRFEMKIFGESKPCLGQVTAWSRLIRDLCLTQTKICFLPLELIWNGELTICTLAN